MRYSLANHPLWTLLLWLRHRPLTHRFELSSPPHLLHWSWKLSHWLTLAPHSIVTRPQEHNALSSHWHGDVLCLTPFMVCPIQESEQPRSSSRPGSYGLVSMQMFAAGPVPVYSASVPRSNDTLQLHSLPFTTPNARFDVIHIDLVGPLPPSRGFTYLLTCVDRFTRWPEAIPLTCITAEAVAQAFLSGWISRFGVPSTIVTDRGRQFESRCWNTLMTLLGSKRARTTSYHPQTNGMVERFHRQLKAALKAQPQPDSWMDALPFVLLGIRTTLKEDISATAAEMVYGTTLRLPGEFFTPSQRSLPDPSDYISNLRTHMQTIRPPPPRPTQRNSKIIDGLSTATHVFIRHDAVC